MPIRLQVVALNVGPMLLSLILIEHKILTGFSMRGIILWAFGPLLKHNLDSRIYHVIFLPTFLTVFLLGKTLKNTQVEVIQMFFFCLYRDGTTNRVSKTQVTLTKTCLWPRRTTFPFHVRLNISILQHSFARENCVVPDSLSFFSLKGND